MSKNVISAKDFGTCAKGAKVELNGIFKNPFIVCNLLEKAAKGDFSKVANVNGITRENLAIVAKTLKKLHGNRYAFSFDFLLSNSDLFRKDRNNVLCSVSTSKSVPAFKYDMLDIIAATDKTGAKFMYLKPVNCTIIAIFNAFAKVAKVDLNSTEKAAKEAAKVAEKAAKDSAKEYEKAKKGVISDYNAGRITEFDLADKLRALKEKYAKVA